MICKQTPTILEATERKALESPLPDITREGPMWCKVSVYDGKVSSVKEQNYLSLSAYI